MLHACFFSLLIPTGKDVLVLVVVVEEATAQTRDSLHGDNYVYAATFSSSGMVIQPSIEVVPTKCCLSVLADCQVFGSC